MIPQRPSGSSQIVSGAGFLALGLAWVVMGEVSSIKARRELLIKSGFEIVSKIGTVENQLFSGQNG